LVLVVSFFGNTIIVSAQSNQRTYIVQSGDTLQIIAVRFGTTWQAIATANNLANPNRIYVGQILVIPVATTPAQYYVVQRGDTLRPIAARFGTTWQALATANNLANPNLIHVGNVLVIPATGGPTQPPPTRSYVVQPGDTLMRIAARFGVDIWSIARVNNILNLNVIHVGQTLLIP
jgi:LysM repeat protein